MKKCARIGCEEIFIPTTHNQKYHDSECCRIATNAKIMARYHANKARMSGQPRECDQCGNKLSRYNEDTTCNSCKLKIKVSNTAQVSAILAGVSWQL